MGTYIVTGGAGFIGSHIVDRLLKDGHKAIVIDNFSTGLKENLNLSHPNLTIVNANIHLKAQLKLPYHLYSNNLFNNVDGIFHTAAVARIQQAVQDPSISHDINITGMFNILELMRKNNIPRIVFSSSSSIYGLKNKPPQKETMPADPLNPYSLSKFIGEQYIKTFCSLYGLEGCSLRYFNVWGPREVLQGDLAPIIGLFYRKILQEKKPPTIVGDGQQTRSFTHVSDVVEANILAMNSSRKLKGDVFNIGTEATYTILEVADLVLKSLNMPTDYKEFIPPRPAEARTTQANNKKAKVQLKWEPNIYLHKSISKHAEYYKKLWNVK